jgi:hypothetical protein
MEQTTEIFAEARNLLVKANWSSTPHPKDFDKRMKFNIQVETKNPVTGKAALYDATQRVEFQPPIKVGEIVNLETRIHGYNGSLYCDILKYEHVKSGKS